MRQKLRKLVNQVCSSEGSTKAHVSGELHGRSFRVNQDQLKLIRDYVETEVKKNIEFAKRVAVEGKNEENSIIYLLEREFEVYVQSGNPATKEQIFEWVMEYYNSDGLEVDQKQETIEIIETKQEEHLTKATMLEDKSEVVALSETTVKSTIVSNGLEQVSLF